MLKAAVLEVLRDGPLSSREIAKRMGLLPSGGRLVLAGWLRDMEHKGKIHRVGEQRKGGIPMIVWGLTAEYEEQAA